MKISQIYLQTSRWVYVGHAYLLQTVRTRVRDCERKSTTFAFNYDKRHTSLLSRRSLHFHVRLACIKTSTGHKTRTTAKTKSEKGSKGNPWDRAQCKNRNITITLFFYLKTNNIISGWNVWLFPNKHKHFHIDQRNII